MADAALTAKLAAEAGVGVVAALCGTPEANISSGEAAVAGRGEERIAAAMLVARDMGAAMLAARRTVRSTASKNRQPGTYPRDLSSATRDWLIERPRWASGLG